MKINGSLVFDASSASEIQNLRVQKYANFAAVPAWTSADSGRMVYAIATATLYYGTATAWVAIATGGNAAALQTEVDNIETSLGSLVTGNGVFVPGEVTILGSPSAATDVKGILQELSNAISGKDALSELVDVTFTGLADNQFLQYDLATTDWVNHTLVVADLDGVTASAAELNILDGATLDVTELNYVEGVTSPIQTQLDAKQDEDATLTALAALDTSTGILVQTGTDTFAKRSLVAPADGFTISDAGGVGGDPTFALADDLAAVEGLATTGYAVRTAADTWATRSISGTAGNVDVTNGDGVASNTSINLATVTAGSGGTFQKFTTDTFGRVSAVSAVVTADITALVDATYVNVAGDTMDSAANLVFVGGGTVQGLPNPTLGTDAANKNYVDAAVDGLTWKNAVRVASTGDFLLTGTPTIDGVALVAGDRVLVKDQTNPEENGIYIVPASGNWSRAADMNAAAEFDGAAVFVKEGTLNEGSGWTQTATVATVGTDDVVFSQFTGGALYTWGTGLSNTGNTINVNLGAGIAQLPSDEVGIDLFDASTGAIILTDDGTTRAGSPATNSKLHLLLDTTATGGLNQGALGLFIKAAGVTNAMLANDSITTNADTGTDGDLALGGTLEIAGDSAKGITTAVAGSVFTISALDASISQKGVASFNTADFAVTAGDVTIKAAGVDNAQLANPGITIAGTTGSDAVDLGETLTFSSTVSGLVLSTVATNGVALDVRLATASLTGVASFAAADFDVSVGGEVTAVAKALDSLTDVVITSPAGGQTIVYNGTNFVNRKVFHTETFTSSTSWVVTHGLGQKFCNVTVVDSTDEVVIPQSIKFDSATQLTVTFNTALAGQVIVAGINAGA